MQPTHFQILKISKQTSKYTGKPVFAVFFKGSDGLSYRTWIDPGNGNYRRWEGVMKVNTVLTGLKVKAGRLIDADSYPQIARPEAQQDEGE